MLEFDHPWLFLMLPLPMLVWWLLPPHRERISAIRAPFFGELVKAAGATARQGAMVTKRRWFQGVAMGLIWILIVAGLAKPQWVGDPIVREEATRDVMLAIDLSGSMDYADFPDGEGNLVRRFDAVQRVVDQFVADREKDRIGLIVFGNRAYLQLPFTRDLKTAGELVALMNVGMAGPKTAIGDAIGFSIRSFESSETDDRLLILLTDGNDTASKMTPLNAAEIAKLHGVEIFTIGVGDPAANGEDRVDFDVLEDIAGRTGGQFFKAENENALTEVYARIDQISPGELKTQTWRPRESLVYWPAGLALLLGLAGYLLMLILFRERSPAA